MPKLFLYAIYLYCLLLACSLFAEADKDDQAYDYQLAIAAIFCDEGPYLREWIEYHKLIGVEHFYLYNNLSSDNYDEVLEPYIERNEVELIDWPYEANNSGEWDKLQVDAYRDALSLAMYNAKWLAIIDIDEFIVPVNKNDLLEVLDSPEYSSRGGICMMWAFFGTSHVEKIPEDKLLIESLLYNSGPASGGNISAVWNSGSYKSIVRPDFVKKVPSPHYCLYIEGKAHTMADYDIVRINHYWTRDEYYLNQFKIPRRKMWGQEAKSVRAWANGMNAMTGQNPILQFVPKLKQTMQSHP